MLLSWIGHVERMEKSRMPKRVMRQKIYTRRKRGRPKVRWLDNGGNFLFSLCTLSVLLCPNCPGFAFCPYCTSHTTQASMPPAGFEPATPASEQPQILALDRSATGIDRIRSPDRPAPSESLHQASRPTWRTYMVSSL